MDFSAIVELIVKLVSDNPKLAGFCSIAYLIGLGSKLIREAVENFVKQSPSKEDDKKLEQLKSKKAFKVAEKILDVLFRLKKPEIKG